MALSRGLNRGRQVVQSRRLTSWDLGPGGSTAVGINSNSLTILGSGSQATVDGLTIVRIRGRVYCYLSAAAAVDNGFALTFGMGICTNQAFAIGATAVPSPLDEADWDGWLWHQFVYVMSPLGAPVEAPTSALFSMEVDSKAMRKLPQNQTLFVAVDAIERGAATVRVDFDSRVLVKLP